MKQAWKVLGIFVGIMMAIAVALVAFKGLGLLVLMVLGGIVGWIAFSFFHYRYVRQEELLHVLVNAVASGTPLSAAMWAYADDRPRSRWREMLVAVILTPFYYWAWHRWHNFDHKVEHVAGLLDAGASLHEALIETPGVASRETVLASAIGESSGQLARCLTSVPRWRLATVWLEVLPRVVYPFMLLLFVMAIALFILVMIVPKFEKIFADFKVHLPWATGTFIGFSRGFLQNGWALSAGALAVLGLITALCSSSRVRWHFPVLGRLCRMQARSRVLKTLALLLETGQTIPEALAIQEESGYFSGTVLRRLRMVRVRVVLGEPFARELCRHGLLPESMVPLLEAAERAQNLSWALNELGDKLGQLTVRSAQRLSMTLFPTAVMAVGLVVGFFALAMFSPLVTMLAEIPL